MTLVHNIAWDETVRVDRIIDHVKGKKGGPTVVFLGVFTGTKQPVFLL